MKVSKRDKINFSYVKLFVFIFLFLFFSVLNLNNPDSFLCKSYNYKNLLVNRLYEKTNDLLRNDDNNMYVVVGVSIQLSDLNRVFDEKKEASIDALKGKYNVRSISSYSLDNIYNSNDHNEKYTLIFPGGDGGLYFIYPSDLFERKGGLVESTVYSFDITNKNDFFDSKTLLSLGRLRAHKVSYLLDGCMDLIYKKKIP